MNFEKPFPGAEVTRPTQDEIHEKAKDHLLRFQEHGRTNWEVLGDWKIWSGNEVSEDEDGVEDPDRELRSNKIREENYPGWSKEDFATLLRLYEEGERHIQAKAKMKKVRITLGIGNEASLEEVVQKLRELDAEVSGNKASS